MPGMDGTGPLGDGPFGRRMGPCGSGELGLGRRRGFRRGGGLGWRNLFTPTDPVGKKEILERHKEVLETQLANINKELDEA